MYNEIAASLREFSGSQLDREELVAFAKMQLGITRKEGEFGLPREGEGAFREEAVSYLPVVDEEAQQEFFELLRKDPKFISISIPLGKYYHMSDETEIESCSFSYSNHTGFLSGLDRLIGKRVNHPVEDGVIEGSGLVCYKATLTEIQSSAREDFPYIFDHYYRAVCYAVDGGVLHIH
jgi:hypothetical protein